NDHHSADVRGRQPFAGQLMMYPEEYPNAMKTRPPIMSPMPAPTTGDRSGFAEAMPMEANTRPTSNNKTFGQTVDHVPMGLAGQPYDTLVWLNHVCRLQPTGNGVKGARTVARMPSDVTH